MAAPWEKYAAAPAPAAPPSDAAPAGAPSVGPWAKWGGSTRDERIAAQQEADRKLYDPTNDMSTTDRLIAGIGSGMAKVGRAVGQLTPWVSQSDIDEANKLDQSLANTRAGKVGRFVGEAATVAPVALIPGANTVLGAAAIGAGTGALTTEGGLKERALGAAGGAAGGVAGKYVGDAVGAGARYVAQKVTDAVAARQVANAGRSAAVQAAQDAGYVLPPTEMNPSIVNSALEGLSGKIKTAQAASTKNQATTNQIAKTELGLPQDQPITRQALANLRSDAGAVYEQVKQAQPIVADKLYQSQLAALQAPIAKFEQQFPQLANKEVSGVFDALNQGQFDTEAVVEAMKRLRFDGQANKASLDPAKKELGRVQVRAAEALEGLTDRNLSAQGQPDLMAAFQDARKTIAKTYSVEKALNDQTGDVSAAVLAAQLKKGKPLSGGIQTIAEAGQAFPKATQTLPQSYNAVSPVDYLGAGLGAAATGHPLMLALAAARPAVRKLVLSDVYQNAARGQNYQTGTLADLLSMAGNSPALRTRFVLGGAGLGSAEATKQ